LNILRRLSLARLLLLCGLVVATAISATAIASALDEGPVPSPKPLADAVHDALSAAPVQGVSANVQLTNHLLEGASLASGGGSGSGQLTSSPLIAGGSGRLWIDKGHARLELQSEAGDTQVLFDGHTLQVYDAATNTLYRYTPPAHEAQAGESGAQPQPGADRTPSIAKIEEAIAKLNRHLDVSEARSADVAGQPAYTVRVSPREGGSLLGGLELSWDASNGVPLRTAIYSSSSSAPVVELAMSEVSFGPIESSVFAFTPPPGAKVEEVRFAERHATSGEAGAGKPTLTTHGHGPATIAVLERKSSGEAGDSAGGSEDLPKVTIDGTGASELKTELGTLLTFERSGVRYVVAGAVPAAAVEEVARGL
jgi:outer membrane lipoprotein-sorting protein